MEQEIDDTGYILADIDKVIQFEKRSAQAIKEFDAIKNKFNTVNATLLTKWKGLGATAYKKETDHILENIGGIKDVLDGINNGAVKDIKDSYVKLDNDLAEFNKKPPTDEESNTSGSGKRAVNVEK